MPNSMSCQLLTSTVQPVNLWHAKLMQRKLLRTASGFGCPMQALAPLTEASQLCNVLNSAANRCLVRCTLMQSAGKTND